jgi:hypothetical protein
MQASLGGLPTDLGSRWWLAMLGSRFSAISGERGCVAIIKRFGLRSPEVLITYRYGNKFAIAALTTRQRLAYWFALAGAFSLRGSHELGYWLDVLPLFRISMADLEL